MTLAKFNWRALERKWQKKWAWAKVDQTDPDPRRPKYFVTAAYPYPNSPQHIGHARTYTIADANARFHRMRGFNTLYPMGFHYTGTPLYAMAKRLSQNDPEIIETFTKIYGIPAAKLDGLKEPRRMADYFRDDIKKGMIEIGFSVDWRREFTTADRLYNRFIQWHFRWLNQHGFITKGTHPVAWCPNDKNPVGVVDIQGGVEPEIGDSHLVKFENNRTSIVMSVPGHAPYDYQALMDLKTRSWTSSEPEDTVRKIEPISIIRLEGFSEFPAADMVKKFEISGQKDPRLAQATKDLYSK